MQKINYLSTKIFPILHFYILHVSLLSSLLCPLPLSLQTYNELSQQTGFNLYQLRHCAYSVKTWFKNVCTYTIAVAYLTYTIKLLTWVNGGKYWIYLDTKASWPQLYIDTRIYVLVYCWWTNLIDIGIKFIKTN